MLLERVEVLPERVEELLSRLTVVVRPDASVVFTVVRVVPLLLTLVWMVVEGADERVVVVVVLVERAEVPPVLVVEAAVVVVLDDLVELVVLEELVELEDLVVLAVLVVLVFASSLAGDLFTSWRSCPALRTETPFVLEAVRVTRCSNESFGCWVA